MKEELQKKKKKISWGRKTIYVIILIICIATIATVIYVQFFKEEKLGLILGLNNLYRDIDEEKYTELKMNFDNIFSNKINKDKDYNIRKIDNNNDYVYTKYKIEQNRDKYELNLNIPFININSSIVEKYNNDINEIFVQKVISILQDNRDNKYVYKIEYTSYLYDGILSIIIRSNLKEGNSPQRVIVQTYNYNIETNQEITIDECLEKKNISKQYATTKIKREINEQAEKIEELRDLGYDIYQRDYTNEMYNLENVSEFFIDNNGYLYIVYAYGNDNFTSEMDFVIF